MNIAAHRQQKVGPARRATRHGSTTVEMALVLPIFFVILFAAFEIGRANLIRHGAESAAYEAVRAAIVPGATNADVQDAARRVLQSVGVEQFAITTVPANVQTPTDELEVNVTVPLEQNMSFASFVNGLNFTGHCRLTRERR